MFFQLVFLETEPLDHFLKNWQIDVWKPHNSYTKVKADSY